MSDKLYHWPSLLYAEMKKIGLATGKTWLLKEERAGRLKVRISVSGRRLFTRGDIAGIIKAYSPGGSGHWSYED